MNAIETFLAQYPSTISALAAVSTFAAVVVALYLARRQHRPRLQVFADINLYISPDAPRDSTGVVDMKDAPRVITVTIRNIGLTPVSISYWSAFWWSVLGGKETAIQNPVEPVFKNEPIELQPGKSASIVLSNDLEAISTLMKSLAATSRLGNLSRFFPRLTIMTEVGYKFRAKLGNSLRALARGS